MNGTAVEDTKPIVWFKLVHALGDYSSARCSYSESCEYSRFCHSAFWGGRIPIELLPFHNRPILSTQHYRGRHFWYGRILVINNQSQSHACWRYCVYQKIYLNFFYAGQNPPNPCSLTLCFLETETWGDKGNETTTDNVARTSFRASLIFVSLFSLLFATVPFYHLDLILLLGLIAELYGSIVSSSLISFAPPIINGIFHRHNDYHSFLETSSSS